MIKSVKIRKGAGRPSVKEQEENLIKCKKMFYDGLSILSASEKTGLNKETVCNYYKEFREDFVENLDNNFVDEQRTAKQMALKKLEESIEQVEAAAAIALSNSHGEDGSPWYGHYLRCLEMKASFEQQRYALEMQPTIDVSLERLMEEGLAELETCKPGNSGT